MNSEEIETKRMETLHAINAKMEQINLVSCEIHALEKQLQELQETRRQAKHTLAILRTNERIYVGEYWLSKK